MTTWKFTACLVLVHLRGSADVARLPFFSILLVVAGVRRVRAVLARKLAVICLMALHRLVRSCPRRYHRHPHHRCLSSSVGTSLRATISGRCCWEKEGRSMSFTACLKIKLHVTLLFPGKDIFLKCYPWVRFHIGSN